MRLRVVSAGLIAWVVAIAWAATCQAQVIDRVLAIVGPTVITQSDAEAALVFGLVRAPQTGTDPIRATLDQLIRRELILGEVNRYAGAEANAAEVARRMAAIRNRFASDADFQAALARTAMDVARLRDIVEGDVRIDEYMQQRFGAVAEPTDEEVNEYYATHHAEFAGPGRSVSLEEARPVIRQRIAEERRASLIGDWVARLRRRAEVTDVYFADRGHD